MPEVMFTADGHPISHARVVSGSTIRTTGGNPVTAVRVIEPTFWPAGYRYTPSGFPIRSIRLVDDAGAYTTNRAVTSAQPEDVYTPDGNPIEAIRIFSSVPSPEVVFTADGYPIEAVNFVDAAGEIIGFEAEETAWSAAVVAAGGSVSGNRKVVVNALINTLKSAGIWTGLDRLWIFAAENQAQALVDLVGLSSALIPTPPTFIPNRGFLGGGGSYINTNFNPITAPTPDYVQNSASYGVWQVVADFTGGTGALMGNTGGPTRILTGSNGTTYAAQINASPQTMPLTASAPNGLFMAQRTGAASNVLWRNGVVLASTADASAAPASQVFGVLSNFGTSSSTGSNATIGTAFIGNSQVGKELAFYNAMRSFMTAIGVP